MKLEKLTENKIRILINSEDIKEKNIDINSIMKTPIEAHKLFLEMLDLAEKQLGFYTDGYKLLIESFSSPDNDFVFTITKCIEPSLSNTPANAKHLVVKKKKIDLNISNCTYSFESFESFCTLCDAINSSKISIRGLATNIALYYFNEIYYLSLRNIKINPKTYQTTFALFSEFGKLESSSEKFELKLLEHGKTIIPKSAINLGIKYFSK